MAVTNYNENTLKLKDLVTAALINAQYDQATIDNVNNIHDIFKELTQISGQDEKVENLAAVPTAHGKALGLNHAALCLLDYRRTITFLKAMVKVINDKKSAHPKTPINIFYAGCGPYAPFLCMIAPLFSPEEVRFSILEINPASLESAKKLIAELDLDAYLIESFLADAVTFKVPNAESYDVLFSETLDAVLYRECYVPILFNLLPQFNKEVSLIPENVQVDLKFVKFKKDQEGNQTVQETPVGILVDARASVTANGAQDKIPAQLPSVSFELTNMERYDMIVIDTKVIVHDTMQLERGESSLTLPLEMNLEQPFKDSQMIFTYHIVPEIELKYNLIVPEN